MKRLGIITVFMFLMTMLVASAVNINVPSTVELDEKQAGETATGSFTIINNGTNSVTLSVSLQNNNDFEDVTITFSPNSGILILSGENKTISISANIDNSVDPEDYDGNIIISDGLTQNILKLIVPVNPEICDEGKQPTTPNLEISDWELKKNPETDEKDEYFPGDKIVIQSIKVENNGDDEITDITLEAILYDLSTGDEIESIESDPFTLNDNDDKSIDNLEFNVPLDADEGDRYAIYLKIYDNEAEDENCNFESIPITIEKRKRDMKIDLISIVPQTAKCGNYVDFNVNIKNTGSRDDSSVYVKIQDPALKITGQTATFSLDNDDETTKIVRIQLPEDLAEGLYSIESVVIYADSGTTPRSDFGNLTVTCEADNKAPVANAGLTQTVDANNVVTLNGASSSDPDNDQLTYLWTQISGLQVQLSNPTSSVTTFTPASPDTYVFKLDVSDGKVTSSATTSIVVSASTVTGGTTYAPTSAWDLVFKESSLQKAAWVIAIIVLLLVAVYFLKLLISPVKRKPQQPQMPLPQPEFP